MVNGKSFPKVNTQQKRPRVLLEGVFVRVNININKLTINKLTINKLTINKLTINKLTINNLQFTIYAQSTNPTIGEDIKPYVRKYTLVN
jgi:hypothetical protein